MPSKNEALRLGDVIDNADRARSYVAGMSFEAFSNDQLRRDAVERCLERVAEACVKIGRERMGVIAPDQPFGEIVGMGNRLRHDYDGVNEQTVWNVVHEDLPKLRDACARALAAMSGGSSG